jgi:hypothetical protein
MYVLHACIAYRCAKQPYRWVRGGDDELIKHMLTCMPHVCFTRYTLKLLVQYKLPLAPFSFCLLIDPHNTS